MRELAQAFGEDAYAQDEGSMEEVVGTLLRDRRYTVAAAESCTGGLLTSRLTDVPGSSAYVQLSIVAYSNAAKTALLGVPAALIATHGAVSEPVALAMAEGVRVRAGSTIGVGITGIAGPDGGTPDKPVGTVAIAVDGPWVRTSAHARCSAGGSTSSSGRHRPPSTMSAGCCSASGGDVRAAIDASAVHAPFRGR